METIYSFSTDDVVYLKNLYTESICEIDEELFKKLSLKEFPYLISEIDKQVPFVHSKRIVEGDELSLYIVTTMSCNLTCSYGFENDKDRKPFLSSKYDGKKIVNFILDELNFKKYKSLDICFTGGEPLYNFQFIRIDYLEWFHKIVFLDELGLLTKDDVEGTIQHISVHKIYVDKNLTMEACR